MLYYYIVVALSIVLLIIVAIAMMQFTWESPKQLHDDVFMKRSVEPPTFRSQLNLVGN